LNRLSEGVFAILSVESEGINIRLNTFSLFSKSLEIPDPSEGAKAQNYQNMKNISITNSNFITFQDELLTIDILGGVDLQQVERMICTLRISRANYQPFRTTLDLYNDSQNDKLIRTLCDKYELQLLEVSKVLNLLTSQLEEYRLDNLKYTGTSKKIAFELSEEDKSNAIKKLKNKNLLNEVVKSLNTTGIIGENENALILFLALASHKYSNPFSVLCLAKSGIGKSYIIQKLSECMPISSYSFHTQISENALYYFDSKEIQNRALLVEDLEWTTQMLSPLATLQSQGKLVKTRTIKDKDGMFHSSTFEVVGNLCLVACAYSDKNYEELSLPFLCIHLNHTHNQDIEIMEYQKKCKAGMIKEEDIKRTQHQLKCLMSVLENVKIINPYAPFINLPNEIVYPRKSLLLLLNFIEIITYFHQYQREKIVDKKTGEILIQTAIEDIELAFKLLKNSLFRRADELSTTARGFYNWLSAYLTEAKTNQFTALDIRKSKSIHPRTLNNYLNELKLFNYISVVGGNKHREGFIYKLTNLRDQKDVQTRIEKDLQSTLEKIKSSISQSVGKTPLTDPQTQIQ
jgi:DNA-binding HxlR family transcriptional regulator